MKKFIILLFAFAFATVVKAQIITSIPLDGATVTFPDASFVQIGVAATLDQKAYAVVFSIDPVGKTKVLQGKNNNAGAAVTFPSSKGDYKYYSITIEPNKSLEEGVHTLRVDVYGTSFRDLTDTREVTFTIKYF